MALWSYNGCKIFLMVLVAAVPIYSRSPGLVRQSAYAGPFNLKLVNVTKCFDHPIPVDFELTCTGTKSECNRVTGNLTVRRNIDEDAPAIFSVNQYRNGEWKKDSIVMKFKKGFQAFHDNFPEVYCGVFGDNVHPKKGLYKVDVNPKAAVPSVPVFPYGLWKGRMQAFSVPGNDAIFCMDVVLNVVPKKII